jgi:hypothetical protein
MSETVRPASADQASLTRAGHCAASDAATDAPLPSTHLLQYTVTNQTFQQWWWVPCRRCALGALAARTRS